MHEIYVYDDMPPETNAMLQALYSRSTLSIEDQRKKVDTNRVSNFIKNYYIGYGHDSIGDCGQTTLFFENVSMLAAKAIQDNPLYSGQETSSRYIDLKHQNIYNPLPNEDTDLIFKKWIGFYDNFYKVIYNKLIKDYPLNKFNNTDNKLWEKTIKSRCFDILRGFLPLGINTKLSWVSNLRQLNDKLTQLLHHPLKEVQSITNNTLDILKIKYPSSFSHTNNDINEYYKKHSKQIHYNTNSEFIDLPEDHLIIYDNNIDIVAINQYINQYIGNEEYDILDRPKNIRLPRLFEKYGNYTCEFILDFGSFRDLQRHRNGLCPIPLIPINMLGKEYGFNSWYIDQFPVNLRQYIIDFIFEQYERIINLKEKYEINNFELQYYYPMGTNVLVEITYNLPQLIYVLELRSKTTVHPTLRNIIHKLYYNIIKKNHPLLKTYIDENNDDFNLNRGSQDIYEIHK